MTHPSCDDTLAKLLADLGQDWQPTQRTPLSIDDAERQLSRLQDDSSAGPAPQRGNMRAQSVRSTPVSEAEAQTPREPPGSRAIVAGVPDAPVLTDDLPTSAPEAPALAQQAEPVKEEPAAEPAPEGPILAEAEESILELDDGVELELSPDEGIEPVLILDEEDELEPLPAHSQTEADLALADLGLADLELDDEPSPVVPHQGRTIIGAGAALGGDLDLNVPDSEPPQDLSGHGLDSASTIPVGPPRPPPLPKKG